jgi:hypothetical protein
MARLSNAVLDLVLVSPSDGQVFDPAVMDKFTIVAA